ncbi:MAG: GA module-containing protein, partial [Corynebacterium sp.]|nr:GA module-containing protein [Corynebacterium sp.]
TGTGTGIGTGTGTDTDANAAVEAAKKAQEEAAAAKKAAEDAQKALQDMKDRMDAAAKANQSAADAAKSADEAKKAADAAGTDTGKAASDDASKAADKAADAAQDAREAQTTPDAKKAADDAAKQAEAAADAAKKALDELKAVAKSTIDGFTHLTDSQKTGYKNRIDAATTTDGVLSIVREAAKKDVDQNSDLSEAQKNAAKNNIDKAGNLSDIASAANGGNSSDDDTTTVRGYSAGSIPEAVEQAQKLVDEADSVRNSDSYKYDTQADKDAYDNAIKQLQDDIKNKDNITLEKFNSDIDAATNAKANLNGSKPGEWNLAIPGSSEGLWWKLFLGTVLAAGGTAVTYGYAHDPAFRAVVDGAIAGFNRDMNNLRVALGLPGASCGCEG